MDYSQVKGDDGLTDDERRRAKYGIAGEPVTGEEPTAEVRPRRARKAKAED